MSTQAPIKPIKIAIVGMTGSGKTVLISTLATRMAQMALDDIFLSPVGENRRQTLKYTQGNWQTLNSGRWPASTPAGELIDLQWELNTKNCQAQVRFLDCAGQDIRSLFQTEYFDPDSLQGDLKRVYKNINSANVLIFLVNMKDLLATTDGGQLKEILDLDQMFHTLKERKDIPRRMAVVFSQFDKYKPEVDMNFNGDFLEYVRYYLPYLHGQYIRYHNFELLPVAAVNDTQDVLENGIVTQNPVPGFSSYNLEKLIYWIANSVEELALEVAKFYDGVSRSDNLIFQPVTSKPSEMSLLSILKGTGKGTWRGTIFGFKVSLIISIFIDLLFTVLFYTFRSSIIQENDSFLVLFLAYMIFLSVITMSIIIPMTFIGAIGGFIFGLFKKLVSNSE